MKNKLPIVETEDYILAVSEYKPIKEPCFRVHKFEKTINRPYHNLEHGEKYTDCWAEIIAHQPKGNVLELDLPLLPEITVEDDVEKLAMDELRSRWSHLYISGYPKRPFPTNYEHDLNMIMLGYYKAKAIKTFNEEDLRTFCKFYVTNQINSIWDAMELYIQSFKQPKTPKYFVAEMQTTKSEVFRENDNAPYATLKTTTINGKTYLVGYYE